MGNNNIAVERRPIKGIFICLLSYFFMSLIGVWEKSLSSSITIPTVLFFQNIICLTFILFNLRKSDLPSLKTTYISAYFIRIASGLGCYGALFYIIRYMPISQALLYQYSGSLWIPFIMSVGLNVRMPRKLWWGIGIGFLGILIVLKPSITMFSLISLFGILCGFLQGTSMVAARKLSLFEPTLRILFYYFLFGTLVMSPLVIKNWSPIGFEDSLFLFGVGISTYLAQKYFAISLKYADPATLAPVCYTSIIYSGVMGWIFWQETPETITLAGMILVIAGCILTIFMSREGIERNMEYEKV